MRFFKFIFIVTIFTWCLFYNNVSSISAQTNDLDQVVNNIDDIMKEKVSDEHIPNAVVTIVHKGEVIFQEGYGFSDLEAETTIDPETSLFRIGSTSKLFTWTAVMQLVEQGKLDLDTDINEYLDFEIPAQIYKSNNANPSPITLRHLMTHTPGFEDYSDEIFTLIEDEHLSLEDYVKNLLPERVFPAGEVIAYSNYGTALAGYIVEQVSGQPFPEYIQQHIYTPLKMNNSSFHQPLPENLEQHMVNPYRYVDGEFMKADFEFMPGAAGGMSTSASDMVKFMMAFLQDGKYGDKQILQRETVEQMMTQQFSHHPNLDGMTLGFMERTTNGRRVLMHAGSTMIFDTGLYLLPDEEMGILLSYSGNNYTTHVDVFKEIMDQLFSIPELNHKKPSVDAKERANSYKGEYHQNRRSFTTDAKFISLMMGMMHVDVDKEGYLLVNHAGETSRFVETDLGVYENIQNVKQIDPFGTFSTIVFGKDPHGNTLLMTDGPMSYSKAPWYSTSGITFLTLITLIVFMIGTLIYWGIKGIFNLKKRSYLPQEKLSKITKGLAVFYSSLIVVFVVELILNGEFDPVYGLPKIDFMEIPSWFIIFDILFYVMVLNGVVLVFFIGWCLWKKYWKIPTRIHFVVLMLAAIILNGIFYYWNLI